jgi:hypothetical protein
LVEQEIAERLIGKLSQSRDLSIAARQAFELAAAQNAKAKSARD